MQTPSTNVMKQRFSYFVCVVYNKEGSNSNPRLEWVILDTSTREPVEVNEELKLDSGDSFEVSTQKFSNFVNTFFVEHHRTFCVVSLCSHVDELIKDSKAQNLSITQFFEHYADLLSEYKSFANKNGKELTKPLENLGDLFEYIGIGEENTIINENIETIVKAVLQLLSMGHVFQGVDSYKIIAQEKASTSNGDGNLNSSSDNTSKNTENQDWSNTDQGGGEKENHRTDQSSDNTSSNGNTDSPPSSPSLRSPYNDDRFYPAGGKSTSHSSYSSRSGYDSSSTTTRGSSNSNTPKPYESNTGSKEAGGNWVVRMRGLPWQANERDVSNFFSGLLISQGGIHFLSDSANRPTGEGYVQFQTQYDFEQAIQRHKQYMGKRYIEVFQSSLAELNKCLLRNRDDIKYSRKSYYDSPHVINPSLNGYDRYIIRMRGLPYSVRVADIMDFFHGLEVTKEDIFVLVKPNGSSTGEGYVKLRSEELYNSAMKRNNARIGSRYIELFPSSESEFEAVLSQTPYIQESSSSSDRQFDYWEGDGGRQSIDYRAKSYLNVPPNGDHLYSQQHGGYYQQANILKMRGLPYSATVIDIQQFFNGMAILPNGIHIIFNHQGKPSGEAFVEFVSEKDKILALKLKKQQLMGTRYIELFQSSIEELNRYKRNESSYGMVPSDIRPTPGYFNPMDSAQANPLLRFANDPQVQLLLAKAGGNYPIPDVNPHHPMTEHIPPEDYARGYQVSNPGYQPYPEQQLLPENSVIIRGLTADVTVADIQKYFQNYQMLPNSIRVVSNLERTIFEASISFASAAEAQRALRERSIGYIGTRVIKLLPPYM